MNLPKNGRVIIIDDKPSQAMPLISALSRYNISSSYFNGRKETLPLNRCSDVRVLFLDINLNDGPATWENEKSILIRCITSIVAPKTPYILFIWSVNENAHLTDIQMLFENELVDYSPIISPIPMQKDSVFDLIDPEHDRWELREGVETTLKIIDKKISDGLSMIDSFEPLIMWEDIVNDSASVVVNDLISLANSNGDINKGLKDIYFNLAHAYWGKTLKDQTSGTIIPKSLVNLNSILSDKIEHNLLNIFNPNELSNFPSKPYIDPRIRAEINTRLLFSEDTVSMPLPGNLYILENDTFKKEIVESLIDRSSFALDYCIENGIERKDFFEGNEIKKEYINAFTKFGFKKVKEVTDNAMYMRLELTPICDYSQGNRLFCRMVSGVILDEKLRLNHKRSASYFYVSPTFLLDGRPVNFYCDFRYVISVSEDELREEKPRFRIRHLFQSDIQSHLARQVSRPGIVSL